MLLRRGSRGGSRLFLGSLHSLAGRRAVIVFCTKHKKYSHLPTGYIVPVMIYSYGRSSTEVAVQFIEGEPAHGCPSLGEIDLQAYARRKMRSIRRANGFAVPPDTEDEWEPLEEGMATLLKGRKLMNTRVMTLLQTPSCCTALETEPSLPAPETLC